MNLVKINTKKKKKKHFKFTIKGVKSNDISKSKV